MLEPQTLPCRTCFLTYRRNKLRIDAEGATYVHWINKGGPVPPLVHHRSEIQMTNRDTSTVEELEQSLAHLLSHSLGEVLSYAEVQRFMQIREEILRRRAPSANAA
jgi:hypothetical protein